MHTSERCQVAGPCPGASRVGGWDWPTLRTRGRAGRPSSSRATCSEASSGGGLCTFCATTR
eukprot:1560952-Pyramimonas_sp.AAC.1